MSIIRINKNKDNPYVQMDKRAIQDSNLSWKARGILAYLLSLPDDWKIYTTELIKHSPDGEAALRTGMKELEDQGYLIKENTRNKGGKFMGCDYTVIEHPAGLRISPNGSQPHSEIPDAGKPDADNRALVIKDSTKKEKKENSVGDRPPEFKLLDLFREMTKLEMPPSPHAQMFWVRDAGEWLRAGAIDKDIINAINEADKRGTTLAKPSGITSYLKSAIARRKRGVKVSQNKHQGKRKSIDTNQDPDSYRESWLGKDKK